MTTIASNSIAATVHRNRGMIFPLAMIGLLVVILVPLPTWMLDILLICNITLSVIVLVATICVQTPLDLASFPSIILSVTLFRLVLNVATTRLILTAANRVADPSQALGGAGEVVRTFAAFVTGDSLAVGIIIFLIIFVIQFIVITRGAARISEVAARFTLDAMPGRQMAIDAELTAGAITEPQARQRRELIARQADFYGAMDGAGKFVRGDAIAVIVITLISIVGGLYVGIVEQQWHIPECLQLYTRLTIGEGLVSQLPAFILSLAAGLIVTRSSEPGNLGEQILSQVFTGPRTMMIAAAFLVLLSFSGLPKVPLLLLAAGCGLVAWSLVQNRKHAAQAEADKQKATVAPSQQVQQLLEVQTLELEIGYGLVPLVDAARGGDLLARIDQLRSQIALELGIIVPAIRIADRAKLGPSDYVIRIKDQEVARGEVYPQQFLAIDTGAATAPIPGGTLITDPASSQPAYWITESERSHAQALGYAIVQASQVLTDHLGQVVRAHAPELLTRQATRDLLDRLKQRVPALVEEVVGAQIKLADLQTVLQELLRECVPIRDLETILETLGDRAGRITNPQELTASVREALSRTLSRQYADENNCLHCITLDPAMEEQIAHHVEAVGGLVSLPPQARSQLVDGIADAAQRLKGSGRRPVVVCSPSVRRAVRRLIEPSVPKLAVLAYSEVAPGTRLDAVVRIDGEKQGQS